MKKVHQLGILVMLVLAVALSSTQAAESPYIQVGQAAVKKSVLAVAPLLSPQTPEKKTAEITKTIETTLVNDLTFMDMFRFLPREVFPTDASVVITEPGKIAFQDWKAASAELLIKWSLSSDRGRVKLTGYLFDVQKGATPLLWKDYIGEPDITADLAHTFGDDIVTTLTGRPGIFKTKIVMSCDRTGKKELYTMNFDGTDVRQITFHRSIAFAPAWSPDGTKIAYSLYTWHGSNRNPDLYEYDVRTRKNRLLSNRKGINSGAAYAPDGSSLAMTMSFQGNPEIFILNLSSLLITQLTKSFGFDVDPTWSPDGKKIAFVSSRIGRPMIYSMDVAQTDAQPTRLTVAGRYNATPSWSPTNNKIAFAGWIDGKFDIFIMNPDGTKIERLTMNQGNNEDPSFSSDGNFIVFSSNRTGKKNIYVMNIDGTYVKRLTYGMGDCVAPKWSNPPK